MYTGNSTVAIDAKGRTNLPREFRRELPVEADGKVVLVPGPGPTLYCLDAPAYERTLRHLQSLPRTAELAGHLRLMTMLATNCVLDDQNRLTIPPRLVERAGLGAKVTFAGDGDKIMLMTPERFEAVIGMVDSSESYDLFADCLQVPPPGQTQGRTEGP